MYRLLCTNQTFYRHFQFILFKIFYEIHNNIELCFSLPVNQPHAAPINRDKFLFYSYAATKTTSNLFHHLYHTWSSKFSSFLSFSRGAQTHRKKTLYDSTWLWDGFSIFFFRFSSNNNIHFLIHTRFVLSTFISKYGVDDCIIY